MRRSISTTLVAIFCLSLRLDAQCALAWSGQFANSVIDAKCAVAHDDGSGPALYLGIASYNGSPGLVRWRGPGTPFEPVGGTGAPNSTVEGVAIWNDGQGPALYATGSFTSAGGVTCIRIAKWNGYTWSPLGSGLIGAGRALAVYDDGSGPALYAAGQFTAAGGVPAAGVAKWNGSAWSAVATSLTPMAGFGFVTDLQVYDPGTGPRLYAAGRFAAINGVTAGSIASFNGSTWAPLGSGIFWGGTGYPDIFDLEAYDDGGGAQLYVAGTFTDAGGVLVSNVTRWNGTAFDAVAGGVGDPTGQVKTLAKWNTPSGQKLVVGGSFNYVGSHSTRIALWDGTWSTAHAAERTADFAVAHDFGGGERLYITGGINATYPGGSGSAGITLGYVQSYDGQNWSAPTGAGLVAYGDVVLGSHDDGGGARLYAAGGLIAGSGVPLLRVGSWDGTSWSTVGGGIAPYVRAMASVGSQLFVGGGPDGPSSPSTPFWVHAWNGTSWTTPAPPLDNYIYAMKRIDTGAGPALLVGGSFTSAPGVTLNRVAILSGSTWTPLGSGIGNGAVYALAVFDDGTGPTYYAGGQFGMGGSFSSSVAKWNGAQWVPLGSGVSGAGGAVRTLEVFDDGSGPALYAAGDFTYAGGVPAANVARWNGTSWSPLGAGLTGITNYGIRSLLAFGDGITRLYAGGEFNAAGGAPASRIAVWDGLAWSPVGAGIESGETNFAQVTSLTKHDSGQGSSLFAAGYFTTADGKSSLNVAELIPARPRLTLSQLGGPGSGVVVANASLIPGRKYFNIFSVEPAPLGPGTGPYLGLFATNPAVLFTQLIPGFAPPFHFAATSTTTAFGPYPIPSGAVIEAVCFEYTNDQLGCVSVNPHFTVQ